MNAQVIPEFFVILRPSVPLLFLSRVVRRLPDLDAFGARLRKELVVRADRFLVARFFAYPHGKRGAPVTFARERPVDFSGEVVTETTVANMFGNPVDVRVVLEHLIGEVRRANEPATTRILDERIVRSAPAEGIVVQILFLPVKDAAFLHRANNVFVRFFDPATFEFGEDARELAVRRDGAKKFRGVPFDKALLLFRENVEVVFTERARLVHEARSGIGRDVSRGDDAPRAVNLAAVLESAFERTLILVEAVEWRLIAFVEKFGALAGTENLSRRFDLRRDGIDERGRDDHRASILDALFCRQLDYGVFEFRMNRDELVARKRPRRGGPD